MSTYKHFAALTRKNWIIYKRNPCSAVLSIITPLLLMYIMVWLRTKVTATNVDSNSLLRLSHPVYKIAVKNNQLNPVASSRTLEDFFLFNNYTDIFGVGYDVMYDYQSPAYFFANDCANRSSITQVHIPSNMIAFVGQNTSVSTEVLTYMQTLFKDQKVLGVGIQPVFRWFESQTALFDYIGSKTYLQPDIGVCFGVQIETSSSNDWSVNLYFDDQRLYGGSKIVGIPSQTAPVWSPNENKPKLKAYEQYSLDGYSFVQNVIANALLQEVTGVSNATINLFNVPMQSDELFVDSFSTMRVIFSNLVAILYILPMYNMVFFIVKEKEQRTKESMRMMGMTDLPYWLSWFTYYTFQNTITAVLAVIILSINVFPYSNGFYIFAVIWLYGQSLFGEIVLIQACFQRSKYAGIVASVIYFVLIMFNIILAGSSIAPVGEERLLCLIPQVNLYQMVNWLFRFESVGLGMNTDDLRVSSDNYVAAIGFVFFIIDGLLWTLIGFYLEAVIKSEYGTSRHPCFMFMPSSYSCCSKKSRQSDEDLNQQLLDNETLELEGLFPENYEPALDEVTRQEIEGGYLRIQNLQKTYDNGFQAVKGINLKMYQNQIFALLGQNGAGKSTTISILTGLIQKSQGFASVFNLDMFTQGDQVRKFMGVCPQHDILFDYLTPTEHLQIFYDFKGGDPAKKNQEIVDLIRDVGLEEDQNKPAASLSGGNRRKLSVAIAMCGGSKLVLLDEPTAGMDLGARRALWDMLKNYKSDKIIILTTHYMDEADVLGDRIGIMAKGQMMCLGSSLFLKKRFGAGYKLTIVKTSKEKNVILEPYLLRHLGNVELISEISSEISFGFVDVENKFEDFFQQFDQNLAELGVISYGISISTLEEVFLHINKEFAVQLSGKEQASLDTGGLDSDGPRVEITNDYPHDQEKDEHYALNNSEISIMSGGKATFLKIIDDNEKLETKCLVNPSSVKENVSALLKKRLNLYKRDRVGLVCEVIVPFLMVLIGCCMTKINFIKTSVTRVLTPSAYPLPQQILMNEFNVIDSGAGNIPPQTLFANLPDSESDFIPTYNPSNVSFQQFYNDTYAFKNYQGVSKYGAYQVYKADNISKQFCVNTFLNLTSQDVSAFFPQFMYQAVLKTATGNPDFNFQVTTVPFPPLEILKARQAEGNSLEFVFMVGIGISLIPCAMISFILKEKQDNLKHMQLISGMSLPAYWISNMIADVLKVYIPIILIVLLGVAFGSNYPGVWVIFMLLPWGLVPFTYLTSFMFTNDTNAQIMTLLINFVVCVVLATTVYFLQLIPETFALGDKLRWYLCIFPNYCVMNALLWSSEGSKILLLRQSNPEIYPQLPTQLFAFENLGGDVFFLMLHLVVDSALIVLIESNAIEKIKRRFTTVAPAPISQVEYDDDVQNEEERIAVNKSEVVRVYKFRKAYQKMCQKPFLAVENISFGLDYGECFALLGVNGAGKSTTFKSLTAGVEPTNGEITIAGLDIMNEFDQARKLIGYCPQHDAIFPLMTVEEHLWFYAQLKGIPVINRKDEIEKAILSLNLSDHRDKPAGTLSGGNKRKLSVAMATLGNPPIILLDEPSAGMDPEARRFMWQVVANISQRDKNSAVIITTHSMEEAEALSTKMGIMVRGGIFQCFGSSQHIKSKFGTGFEIEIKIKKSTPKEMKELASQLGFVESFDDRVDLDNGILRAKVRGVPQLLLDQISYQGLGSDIYLEASQGGNTVRVKNLIQYFFTLQAGLKVIEFFCASFSKVELYEQCSDFFKMRIPKDGQTIGRMFGSIEANKQVLLISEYSVSETSLEQIFQTFANSTSKNKVKSFVFKLGDSGLELQ